ncbi:DUF5908 family protein [uncultured Dokdonia sp.]|uniref:DUF5908 family protein n=1 Tax=uncultured Dokdonia sp. TaxID=575653 RepID=UPI002623BE6B|nr:DUF5908 family protein [uncultured Dokdonia sp.]
MPIEIKELYIKINVDEGANANSVSSSGAASEDSAAIIAACIEEVMEKLKEQKER